MINWSALFLGMFIGAAGVYSVNPNQFALFMLLATGAMLLYSLLGR